MGLRLGFFVYFLKFLRCKIASDKCTATVKMQTPLKILLVPLYSHLLLHTWVFKHTPQAVLWVVIDEKPLLELSLEQLLSHVFSMRVLLGELQELVAYKNR